MKKFFLFNLLFLWVNFIFAQGFSATITQSNCHSAANGKEWSVTLTAHGLIDGAELTPDPRWTYKWYNNYGGSWHYKRTTSYPTNYINPDGLCGQFYDTKVKIYISGTHFATSDPFLTGCYFGPCFGGGGYKSNNKNSDAQVLPETNQLSNNYPNPFNPSTTIKFQLKEPGFVSLKVYDVLGKEVAHLVNENKDAGFYNVHFDASNLPSGLYVYRITINNFVDTKKMLLTK